MDAVSADLLRYMIALSLIIQSSDVLGFFKTFDNQKPTIVIMSLSTITLFFAIFIFLFDAAIKITHAFCPPPRFQSDFDGGSLTSPLYQDALVANRRRNWISRLTRFCTCLAVFALLIQTTVLHMTLSLLQTK